MTKYALVKAGVVQSVFVSDKAITDFPDIAPFLQAVSDEVECNWLAKDDGTFQAPGQAVPDVITRRQAFLALAQAGNLGAVKAYMSGLSEDDADRITWENATEFMRQDPTIGRVAPLLGMTSDDLDSLFVLGSSL